MSAMETLAWGDVVVVQFPYTDHVRSKRRPAVIVNGNLPSSEDVIIVAITSRTEKLPSQTYMIDWRLLGLTKPSAFKPSIMTVHRPMIAQKFGALSAQDRQCLQQLLRDWILGEA